MKPYLIIFFIIISIKSYSQGYIILKDKQKIHYLKFKERDDHLVVQVVGQDDKQKIMIQDVLGYYSTLDHEFYYAKYLPESISTKLYTFVRKEQVGRINLYSLEEFVYYAGSPSFVNDQQNPLLNGKRFTRYFIEKNHKIESILSVDNHLKKTKTEINGNKRRVKLLKELIADNQEVLQMVEENEKVDHKRLQRIVSKYNLAAYTEPETSTDTTDKASLVFYRRNKRQSDETIAITVKDEVSYLPPNQFLTIKISPYQLTKFCIGTDEPVCEIVDGQPLLKMFYEVSLDSKGEYTLKKRLKKEADFYINEMKLNKRER